MINKLFTLSYSKLNEANHLFHHTQIADFGMARDVADDNYYVTTGGKIPLKWTSPEVAT